MPELRRVVRVFIASPNDLGAERSVAKSIVDEFNNLWAERTGYQVELVGWEDTVSQFGRPQATINKELEQCELFVGLMWKRWGTPPSTSGPYTSGFHEEFSVAVVNQETKGEPEISLYFKDVDSETLRDPGDELKKVLAFRSEVITQKKLLFESFSNAEDFGSRFRKCVTRYVQRLGVAEAVGERSEASTPSPEGVSVVAIKPPEAEKNTPLSMQGAQFLRSFVTKTEGDLDSRPIDPAEVARFRLLSTVVTTDKNDSTVIGPHDANVLYREKVRVEFGQPELRALLNSGLEHIQGENVPLWHWVEVLNALAPRQLFYSTLAGSTRKRIGAFKALGLIKEPPIFRKEDNALELDNEFFFESWLSEYQSPEVKAAALEYLAVCGELDVIPHIKAELSRSSYQTRKSAIEALLRIYARNQPDQLVVALAEHEPESIGKELAVELERHLNEASRTDLLPLSTHKSPTVRRIASRVLRDRAWLDAEGARKLLDDSDSEVRYNAFLALEAKVGALDDKETRDLLLRPEPVRGFFFVSRDEEGERWLRKIRHDRMVNKSEAELARDVPDLIRAPEEFFEIVGRHYSEHKDWLRDALLDSFVEEYKAAIDKVRKAGGETALLDRLQSSQEDTRKALVRRGLDVVAGKGAAADIDLVRALVRQGFSEFSEVDIDYLGLHGDWSDVDLILEAVERPDYRRGLLGISSVRDSRYKAAARAVYSIGRQDISRVLALKLPYGVLAQVIALIPDPRFRPLEDGVIISLLLFEIDSVRRIAAAKCVRVLSKSRIETLLKQYLSGERIHYYNVVYWLDLAISLSKEVAFTAATMAIEKEVNE